MMSPIIRPLTADDTPAYRARRQQILCSKDAGYFSDSYERERRLDESQWREWCREKPEHCILGAFDAGTLVGIFMLTRQGDKDSPIVEWEALWLDSKHRGGRLCKSMFDRAEQWTIDNGYHYAAVFIRATNTPILNVCRKLGFVDAYNIKDELWADGSVANVCALLRDLRPNAADFTLLPVFERFSEAMPFLSQGFHPPSNEESQEPITVESAFRWAVGGI